MARFDPRLFQRWVLRLGKIVSILGVLLVGLASNQLAVANIERNPYFGVFDEAAHYDYLIRLSEGSVPAWGDKYTQETMFIIDCLGSVFFPPGSCDSHPRVPEAFAPSGFSYEAQQPPLGYLPALASSPEVSVPMAYENTLEKLKEQRSELALIWLATIGLLVLWIGFMAPGSSLWAPIGFGVIALNPTFVNAISTFSNDAATVVMVLVWILLEVSAQRHSFKERSKFMLRFLVGIGLGLTKGTLLIIPAVALVIELSRSGILRRDSTFRPGNLFSLPSAPTLMAAIGSHGLFLLWQSSRSVIESSVVLDALLGFSKTDLPNPITYLESLVKVASSYEGSFGFGSADNSIGTLTTIAIVFLVAATIDRELQSSELNTPQSAVLQLPGTLFLFSALAIAAAWPTLSFILGGFDWAASPRFSLMLLPFILVILIRTRIYATLSRG